MKMPPNLRVDRTSAEPLCFVAGGESSWHRRDGVARLTAAVGHLFRWRKAGFGVGVGIGIGIETRKQKGGSMGFGHERLEVYRAAIGYMGWTYHVCEELKGYTIQEEAGDYLVSGNDSDSDTDSDPDKNKTGRWPTIHWTK